MKAIFNNVVIAESDNTVVVEGNHYFPPESVKHEFLTESSLNTVCPWKGTASYYNLAVDGQQSSNAAWYYPTPKDAAQQIKDHIAFYPIVKVVK